MIYTVILGELAVLADVFHMGTSGNQPLLLSALDVHLSLVLGESPLVGSHDLLAPRKLELGATEGLNDMRSVGVLGTHRDNGVANVDTGGHLHGLTIRTTHARGETIGSGAGKHLVLTNNVERVGSGTDVETLLATGLDQVLVARNAGSLKRA